MADHDQIRHKTVDFAVKAMDDDAGTVTLYGAAFGNVDRQDEVIEPGAFTNLPVFVKDGWLAINHDWMSLPAGTIEGASQDATGLLVTSRWHSTPDAQAARTVVRERKERDKSVKCSIGFRVIEGVMETRDTRTVYVIRKAEVFEVSIVNLPANPRAEVTSVKGRGGVITLDQALGLITHIKEGRTLSRQNVGTIREWSKRCRSAADEMDAMVASFDKDQPSGDGDGDGDGSEEAAKAARRDSLRHSLRLRSLRLRSSLNV